ncbi:MAG: twin-arginine translocase subunit TatC [Chloroflexota bacterium]
MTQLDNTAVNSLDQDDGLELTLLQHLNELRIRLTWVAGGIVVFTLVSFIFADQLILYLMNPFSAIFPDKGLNTLSPTEGIETFFKVSILAGTVLSMPLTLYQLWLFISPGMTKRERRSVYIFIPSTLTLFALGLGFSWFVLTPAAIFFLGGFLEEIFDPDWQALEYISFVLRMLFWISVSFQMPIIMYFVARAGLVNSNSLREQWRIAVVGIAVLAAMITPSIDPVTMLLTMAPLNVLYLLSIGLAHYGYKNFEARMAIDGVDEAG